MDMKRKIVLTLSIVLIGSIILGMHIYLNRSTVNRININVDKKLLMNTDGNNINDGQIGAKDNYIYFINACDNSALYRMDLNGNNRIKLVDKVVESFYIQDEWIYMINYDDNKETGFCISKSKLDGSNIKKISTDIASNMVVLNGWIYYKNISDGGKIYKIDIEGGNKQKICDLKPLYISIYDNKIYFIESNTKDLKRNGKLFRVNSDGSELIDLNITTTSQINVLNSKIYFGQKDGLYSATIDVDGNLESSKISTISPYRIIVFNNTIYFTDSEDIKKTRIYSTSINGNNRIKIYEGGYIENLYLVGNYIFFKEGVKNYKMKVIKSDGNELQTFIRY